MLISWDWNTFDNFYLNFSNAFHYSYAWSKFHFLCRNPFNLFQHFNFIISPQRFAWMHEWAFLVAWMRENGKKNCVNVWIEKTCVNIKNNFSIAWMRESALFLAWKCEFPLFTQICANFPDFWIFTRFFPKISPNSHRIGFAWITRITCVNAWIAKKFCVNAWILDPLEGPH